MIASIHVADVGLASSAALGLPKPETVSGLRDIRGGLTARFTDSLIPDPAFGRAAWVGFWDDEASLDRFLEGGHTLADRFADGLCIRARPLRAHGTWPGLPAETPDAREVESDGPVVVMTLGLLKLRRSIPWMKASAKAQAHLENAQGLLWGMGMAKPPFFVATISVWESAAATMAYAYDNGGHRDAIAAMAEAPFMTQEVFARFSPYASSGSLGGRPGLPADWLTSAA